MTLTPTLDSIPSWALYLLIVLVAMIMGEIGFRLGRWWTKRSDAETDESAAAVVGATLALLAFLIVFQVGIAADRFDARRQFVVEEGQAVGTAYLRAGFLPESEQGAIRELLEEYIDIRLAAANGTAPVESVVARSEEIHAELWDITQPAALADPGSELNPLFIESLNQVIEVHADRIAALLNRFPTSVWLAIFFAAALSVAVVGFHTGLDGERNLVAVLALVLVTSAVILLMVDLDRPQEGLLQVSQQTLIDLQRQFAAWP